MRRGNERQPARKGACATERRARMEKRGLQRQTGEKAEFSICPLAAAHWGYLPSMLRALATERIREGADQLYCRQALEAVRLDTEQASRVCLCDNQYSFGRSDRPGGARWAPSFLPSLHDDSRRERATHWRQAPFNLINFTIRR